MIGGCVGVGVGVGTERFGRPTARPHSTAVKDADDDARGGVDVDARRVRARDVARASSSSSASASSSASSAWLENVRARWDARRRRPRRETRCAFMGSGTYDSSDDGDLGEEETFDDDDPERAAFELAEWTARTRRRARIVCERWIRAGVDGGDDGVGVRRRWVGVVVGGGDDGGGGVGGGDAEFRAGRRAALDDGNRGAESCLQAIFF